MAPSFSDPASVNRMSAYSAYSASPSFASTTSSETAMAEIKVLAKGLDRLNDERLEQQRYVPSAQKTDDLSKLAFVAKLDRALGRRMTKQDAVMRVNPRMSSLPIDEKAGVAETDASAT